MENKRENKRLDEMRQGLNRMKAATPPAYHIAASYPVFLDELEYLLGEIDRLQRERDWWERAAETQKDNNLAVLSEVSQLRAKITALEAERDEFKFDCTMQREELKAFNEALYEYAASGSDTKLREVYQNYCVRDQV